MPKFDAPEVKSATSVSEVYVEVPEEDLFSMVHPDIIVNGHHYGPGRHFVSAELAGEISRLIHLFQHGQIKLNRPTVDSKALSALSRTGGVAAGGKYVGNQ